MAASILRVACSKGQSASTRVAMPLRDGLLAPVGPRELGGGGGYPYASAVVQLLCTSK